uniref:stage V sporulation protein D n=1 Tax=Candidatus Ventrenecus sp. TaxID=3085654 RepID=UPI003FF093C1
MFFDNIHTRIRFFFLLIFCLLFIIICRVFYIQVFSYDKLSSLAESLWSRKLPIGADRGEIYDRKGRVLATNLTTTSLVLIPNQIKNPEEVAKKLSEILNSDYNDMLAHVAKKTSIERVHPEGRQLSYDIASKIEELHFDGVYLVKESKRYYPYGTVLSHVLGYVGIDNQGLSGLELTYDKYLTGENGAIKYFSDGKGNRLELSEVYEEPQNGVNLTLTIDLDLQLAAERELDNAVMKYNPEHAIALAMDPNTGEVLAMASRPNFDSNNYQDYDTTTINRNLPIWMTYEPGSTFKIMTLASSLEEKTVNLFEDTYYDSGSVSIDGATIHCWKSGGHGAQTYLNVVENSCNPGFVSLGNKLGVDKLMSYINKFGFGEKTGIDLNGESSGILFNPSRMGPVELATTSFGQGISVTPIQQVTAVSAVINNGYLYQPYIVKSLEEPETQSIVKLNEPVLRRRVISEESSKLARFALESVVANGSGRNAYIENYRVGGKTGTAQKVEDGHYLDGNYILSFVGFMPADDPKIVVYVAIDNPKGVTQYGGVVAAPIAKSILETAISVLNIESSDEVMPREYNWNDTKYYKIPDVVGQTKEEAKKSLQGFQIEYSGEGEHVLYQSPSGNSYVKENGTVSLMLG